MAQLDERQRERDADMAERAGVSTVAATTLTASATAATRTGVRVSSRAKKPGASTLVST